MILIISEAAERKRGLEENDKQGQARRLSPILSCAEGRSLGWQVHVIDYVKALKPHSGQLEGVAMDLVLNRDLVAKCRKE